MYKSFGPKIRSFNFFDKSQVCIEILTYFCEYYALRDVLNTIKEMQDIME